MTPDVIYLDNHLLVVNKPPGMPSQEDETKDFDVIRWAKQYLAERFDKQGNVFAGLVHRLDRPAGGVMLIARTSKAASRLAVTFKERKVTKSYLALVEGLADEHGRAEDYLAKKDRKVRVVRATHPEARKAVLEWKLRGSVGKRSLVEITLETGRAHQIRVQMAARGWPISGDMRYKAKEEFDGKNLALHAWKLGLEHPVKKEPMLWTAPLKHPWPMWVRDLI